MKREREQRWMGFFSQDSRAIAAVAAKSLLDQQFLFQSANKRQGQKKKSARRNNFFFPPRLLLLRLLLSLSLSFLMSERSERERRSNHEMSRRALGKATLAKLV